MLANTPSGRQRHDGGDVDDAPLPAHLRTPLLAGRRAKVEQHFQRAARPPAHPSASIATVSKQSDDTIASWRRQAASVRWATGQRDPMEEAGRTDPLGLASAETSARPAKLSTGSQWERSDFQLAACHPVSLVGWRAPRQTGPTRTGQLARLNCKSFDHWSRATKCATFPEESDPGAPVGVARNGCQSIRNKCPVSGESEPEPGPGRERDAGDVTNTR